jgi:hypothetical protein
MTLIRNKDRVIAVIGKKSLPRINADDRGSGKGRNSPRRRGGAEKNRKSQPLIHTDDTDQESPGNLPRIHADDRGSGKAKSSPPRHGDTEKNGKRFTTDQH